MQIVFFSQISLFHCANKLNFDIAKRWKLLDKIKDCDVAGGKWTWHFSKFQVYAFSKILKLSVNNLRAIFWSSVLPNNEHEGWRNHCHHLEISFVIKIYGTDSILLQDCTQFPDQFFWMNVQTTTDSYSRETKDLQPGKKNRKNKPQDFSFIDERRN